MAADSQIIRFRIEQWQTWPAADESSTAPALAHVPSRLRRRLDPLGKIAAHLAGACLHDETATPLVFASRHGALQRTVTLLEQLAQREPLSPTAFSLSVHNSTPGILSMARRDRSAVTAISASDHSLSAALIEAYGQLFAGAPRVCVVYADLPICAPYRDPLNVPSSAQGIGLLLTNAHSADSAVRLTSNRRDGTGPETPSVLHDFLQGKARQVELGNWSLTREAAA